MVCCYNTYVWTWRTIAAKSAFFLFVLWQQTTKDQPEGQPFWWRGKEPCWTRWWLLRLCLAFQGSWEMSNQVWAGPAYLLGWELITETKPQCMTTSRKNVVRSSAAVNVISGTLHLCFRCIFLLWHFIHPVCENFQTHKIHLANVVHTSRETVREDFLVSKPFWLEVGRLLGGKSASQASMRTWVWSSRSHINAGWA